MGPGIALQRLAHVDVGDDITGIVDFRQGLQASSTLLLVSWANSKRRSPLSLYLITYLVVAVTTFSCEVCGSAQFGAGATHDADLVGQRRLLVTLMARRVTTSRVMFQNPVLGAVILAGNVSKAPPW